MEKYYIEAMKHPSEIDVLVKGLNQDAEEKGFPKVDYFGFFIKDKNKRIFGGITGYYLFGNVYINLLWIDKKLRMHGHGTMLVNKVIEYAKNKKSTFVTVETMNWQAVDFYKKLGFKVEFIGDGYLKDSSCYFFKKIL